MALIATILFIIPLAYAALNPQGVSFAPLSFGSGAPVDLAAIIAGFIKLALAIVLMRFVGKLLHGFFKQATHGGNEDAKAEAHKIVSQSVLSIILVSAAFPIIGPLLHVVTSFVANAATAYNPL